MGGNLEDETAAREVLDLQGIENGGEVVSVKLDVNDGTNDGLHGADRKLGVGRIGAGCFWVS